QSFRLDSLRPRLVGSGAEEIAQLVGVVTPRHRAREDSTDRLDGFGLEVRDRWRTLKGHHSRACGILRGRESTKSGPGALNVSRDSAPVKARGAAFAAGSRRMPFSESSVATTSQMVPMILILSDDAVGAALLGAL